MSDQYLKISDLHNARFFEIMCGNLLSAGENAPGKITLLLAQAHLLLMHNVCALCNKCNIFANSCQIAYLVNELNDRISNDEFELLRRFVPNSSK